MKFYYSFFLLLAFISTRSFAQKVNQVIKKDIYTSYISTDYKEPLYVVYKLYHGGGDCDRAGFTFKNDTHYKLATNKDYAGAGYDKGHLANAEDFAGNCKKDEETFRYYNCLPQTVNLNRGIWKKWETVIRKESAKDSLLIICGGICKSRHKTIGDGVAVPDYCYKVVISLTTHKFLHILLFTNSEDDSEMTVVSLDELQKQCGYKLPVD